MDDLKKTDTVFVCFLPHWRCNSKEPLQPLPVLSVDMKASGIPAPHQKQLLPACLQSWLQETTFLLEDVGVFKPFLLEDVGVFKPFLLEDVGVFKPFLLEDV